MHPAHSSQNAARGANRHGICCAHYLQHGMRFCSLRDIRKRRIICSGPEPTSLHPLYVSITLVQGVSAFMIATPFGTNPSMIEAFSSAIPLISSKALNAPRPGGDHCNIGAAGKGRNFTGMVHSNFNHNSGVRWHPRKVRERPSDCCNWQLTHGFSHAPSMWRTSLVDVLPTDPVTAITSALCAPRGAA